MECKTCNDGEKIPLSAFFRGEPLAENTCPSCLRVGEEGREDVSGATFNVHLLGENLTGVYLAN